MSLEFSIFHMNGLASRDSSAPSAAQQVANKNGAAGEGPADFRSVLSSHQSLHQKEKSPGKEVAEREGKEFGRINRPQNSGSHVPVGAGNGPNAQSDSKSPIKGSAKSSETQVPDSVIAGATGIERGAAEFDAAIAESVMDGAGQAEVDSQTGVYQEESYHLIEDEYGLGGGIDAGFLKEELFTLRSVIRDTAQPGVEVTSEESGATLEVNGSSAGAEALRLEDEQNLTGLLLDNGYGNGGAVMTTPSSALTPEGSSKPAVGSFEEGSGEEAGQETARGSDTGLFFNADESQASHPADLLHDLETGSLAFGSDTTGTQPINKDITKELGLFERAEIEADLFEESKSAATGPEQSVPLLEGENLQVPVGLPVGLYEAELATVAGLASSVLKEADPLQVSSLGKGETGARGKMVVDMEFSHSDALNKVTSDIGTDNTGNGEADAGKAETESIEPDTGSVEDSTESVEPGSRGSRRSELKGIENALERLRQSRTAPNTETLKGLIEKAEAGEDGSNTSEVYAKNLEKASAGADEALESGLNTGKGRPMAGGGFLGTGGDGGGNEAGSNGHRALGPQDFAALLARDGEIRSLSFTESLMATEAGVEPSSGFEHTVKVYEKFSQALKMSFLAGGRQVNLRLSPEHLGTLEIKLTGDGENVNARIIVDSRAVKNLLDSDSAKLRELFAQQGLNMDKYSVDVREQSVGTDGNKGAELWERSESKGRRREGNREPVTEAGHTVIGTVTGAAYGLDRQGGIDLFA